jgi:hypothetical protein
MSVLSEWLAVLPETIIQTQNSIDNIDVQLADLTAKQGALNSVLSTITTDMTVTLLPAKAKQLPEYTPYVYSYGGYGATNVSEWVVYSIMNISVTREDDTSFYAPSGTSLYFPGGTVITVDDGGAVSGWLDFTVSSYTPSGASGLVTVSGNVLPGTIVRVLEKTYVYGGIGWDSDATITENINDFVFTYDHLTQPLGLGGTYGINDMITKLGIGRGILVINKAKYTGSLTTYDRFA